jgi:hypothetical protein
MAKVNAKKLWKYANNLEKTSMANKAYSSILDKAGFSRAADGYFKLSDVQGNNATRYRDKAITAINKATKGRDIPLPPTEFNS